MLTPAQNKPQVHSSPQLSVDLRTQDFHWNIGAWKSVGYTFSCTNGFLLGSDADKAKIAETIISEIQKRFPPLPGMSNDEIGFRQGFILGAEENLERYAKTAYSPNNITTPGLSILGPDQKIPGLSLHTSKSGDTIRLELKDEFTKDKRIFYTITSTTDKLKTAIDELLKASARYIDLYKSRNDRFLNELPLAEKGMYSIALSESSTVISGVERSLLQDVARNSKFELSIAIKPRGPADVVTGDAFYPILRSHMLHPELRGIDVHGEITAIVFNIPQSSYRGNPPPVGGRVEKKDQYGNTFIISQSTDYPGTYNVIVRPRSTSSLSNQPEQIKIDFSPIGRTGESTLFFKHTPPKALSQNGATTISSGLDDKYLKDLTSEKREALFKAIQKIEVLFGYTPGQLAKHIKIEKAHDAAAYASSGSPDTVFIDDDTLKASAKSLSLTGLHETAHLIDLASGWKLSQSLKPLHDRLTKTNKDFFNYINKECFVLDAQLKDHHGFDHSATDPAEFFSSLIISITALSESEWKRSCADLNIPEFIKPYREALETIEKTLSTSPPVLPAGIKPEPILKLLRSRIAHLKTMTAK